MPQASAPAGGLGWGDVVVGAIGEPMPGAARDHTEPFQRTPKRGADRASAVPAPGRKDVDLRWYVNPGSQRDRPNQDLHNNISLFICFGSEASFRPISRS